MAQLLDRYRRLSDGKEFAITAVRVPTPAAGGKAGVTLDAEDGERVESFASTLRQPSRFERIDD